MMRTVMRRGSLSRNTGLLSRKMHIEAIKMRWGRGDNYSYLITDDKTRDSWIVDPAEPSEVLPVLSRANINLKAIVNTHHHHDHSGGNEALLKAYPNLPIIAGADSPLVTFTPKHMEKITLGENLQITALHTPCHTQDSICYFVHDTKTESNAVISGDTLFNAGCGRFFEGDGAQMNSALNLILARLPINTVVYPGHEYTRSNVRFNLKVMPENKALQKLSSFVTANEVTTGKFTIGDEKLYNPFMRLNDPSVIAFTGKSDPHDVMNALREAKNNS